MSDPLYEHRFWLQILGDHCRFILPHFPQGKRGYRYSRVLNGKI